MTEDGKNVCENVFILSVCSGKHTNAGVYIYTTLAITDLGPHTIRLKTTLNIDQSVMVAFLDLCALVLT